MKLLFKEELRPAAADPLLFYIAPVISAVAAFAAFSVVPFGSSTSLLGSPGGAAERSKWPT